MRATPSPLAAPGVGVRQTGGERVGLTILGLLCAYALALLAYWWLHPTLENENRWRMFRLLMLIPLSCVAAMSLPSLGPLIRFLM